jgi:hypothetical protein
MPAGDYAITGKLGHVYADTGYLLCVNTDEFANTLI